MVEILRCLYCAANLELWNLDDHENYMEEFTTIGCTGFLCPGNQDNSLKSPERLMFESLFGDEDIPEGLYLIDLEDDGEE